MQQILRTVDFDQWKECYVGCSGTFTFERMIRDKYPKLKMHGNDVSLLSCALAGKAMGKPLPFAFKERLAHWEDLLVGADDDERLAALILAMQLGRAYTGTSEHAMRHWRYYENRFPDYIEKTKEQLAKFCSTLKLDSYVAGDFREHLRTGMKKGAGVIVSAPFNFGFYENWFKFINANIQWQEPTYDMWDPDRFLDFKAEVEESGVPYVMVYKRNIDDDRLCAYFRVGMKPPYYVFSNTKVAGSVVDRASTTVGKPFRFKAVDIDELDKDTHVEIVQCKAGYADYIKGLYIQETIRWTSAQLNFLVYLDDMLAGILCFSPPKFGLGEWEAKELVYLLSDTCTTRFGRVSKLIAMLATQEDVLRVASRKLIHRRPVKQVVTTVRSNHPVSMKYRSTWKLHNRKDTEHDPNETTKYVINYISSPRNQTPNEIYAEWFSKYFKDDRSRRVTNSYAA